MPRAFSSYRVPTTSTSISTWSSRSPLQREPGVLHSVRACADRSVFRELGEITAGRFRPSAQTSRCSMEPQERALMKTLSRYPEVVELAASNRAPQHVVHYLRELANDFHTYYNAHALSSMTIGCATRVSACAPQHARSSPTASACSASRRPTDVMANEKRKTPQAGQSEPAVSRLGLDAVRPRDRPVGRIRHLCEGRQPAAPTAAAGSPRASSAPSTTRRRRRAPRQASGRRTQRKPLHVLRHAAEFRSRHPGAGPRRTQGRGAARGRRRRASTYCRPVRSPATPMRTGGAPSWRCRASSRGFSA